MKNITKDIQRYREVVRHLWNSCLVNCVEQSPGATYESFGRICEELFDVLILEAHGSEESAERLNVAGFKTIRVVPAIKESVPLIVNRSNPSGTYWDDSVKLKPDDCELLFIGFFDWDRHNTIEMRYLRVLVASCAAEPRVVGRHALIEMLYSEVVYV